MSSSLLLTNLLFCGCSALILISLLGNPKAFIGKGKNLLLIALCGIVIKLFLPFEFAFTQTLKSTVILTFIRKNEQILLFPFMSIKTLLSLIWLSVSVGIFCYLFYQHLCIKRLISRIPFTPNPYIASLVKDLCTEENIKNIPNVLQLNTTISPFVFGTLKPTIILPCYIQKQQLKPVIMHELQHIKQGHLYIKFVSNVIFVLYWWFPIVWLLNNRLSQALEYQADYYATHKLKTTEKINYLEVLLSLANPKAKQMEVFVPLSFVSNEQMLKNRIHALCNSIRKKEKPKSSFSQKIRIALAFAILFLPFFYTFEAAFNPTPEELDGAIRIDSENSYFIINQMKSYDLYVDGNYLDTFESVPNDFKDIKIKSNAVDLSFQDSNGFIIF